MSYHTLTSIVREYMPGCQFLNGQTCGYVCIETLLLSLPPLCKNTNRIVTSEAHLLTSSLGEPAADFVDSLKQVLPAYLREGTPPIALAVGIANTSVRTLQRELSKDKLTYLDLLAQIRFEMASRLLKDKNTQIQEIAYKLGYNDASYFARAFRRTARGHEPVGISQGKHCLEISWVIEHRKHQALHCAYNMSNLRSMHDARAGTFYLLHAVSKLTKETEVINA